MFLSDEELLQAARLLAKHYREPERRVRACSCIGLSCNSPDCAMWWDMVLRELSLRDIGERLRFEPSPPFIVELDVS